MKDKELYQQILGLQAPWRVAEVNLDPASQEIVVRVECDGELYACPECRRRMHIHERTVRKWRHLDSCQFKTFIEASVPRVACPEHGTRVVQVPWAEKGSRFTLLFERLAIDLLRECSVATSAGILRISWDQADGIMERAVRRGLARKDPAVPEAVCVDGKRVAGSRQFATVVVAVPRAGGEADGEAVVDYVAMERERASLDGYWGQWTQEQLEKVVTIGMDMWEPYLLSALGAVPGAEEKIVHDRFHLVKQVNAAVDAVRRAEMAGMTRKEARELKGTRHMWLYGFEKLPGKWGSRMAELKDSALKTARAWGFKERFRLMFEECSSKEEAADYFRRWFADAKRSKLKPVMEVADTFKRHLGAILNWFVHFHSNAHSESMNSRIQALIKRANGYRNMGRLANALYFNFGGLDLYPRLAI